MTGQFLGEIMIFGGNFAPHHWALCSGQLLSIQQNTALFSLVGTFYGGNGTSTFGLPNMQCQTPIGVGQGPGLSPYSLGEEDGTDAVTLLLAELPFHGHQVTETSATAAGKGAGPAIFASSLVNPQATGVTGKLYAVDGTGPVALHPSSVPAVGGSQPHENRQPYLGITFCISLVGIFPARN